MKKVIKSIFQYVGAILLAIVIAALLRFFYRGLLQHPFRLDVPDDRTGRFYRGEQNVHGSPLLQKLRFLGRRTPGNRAGTGVLFTETQ